RALTGEGAVCYNLCGEVSEPPCSRNTRRSISDSGRGGTQAPRLRPSCRKYNTVDARRQAQEAGMEAKRLNKFIADSGYCSRREADRLIAEGRVRVDGRVGALGDQVQPGMRVEVDGKPLSGRGERVYLMLNKPVGIVC